jgi:hypothetical protein
VPAVADARRTGGPGESDPVESVVPSDRVGPVQPAANAEEGATTGSNQTDTEAKGHGHHTREDHPITSKWLGGAGSRRSVHWLADYVYGTISTLVAIAGLTFETNPGAVTTAGVVVIGAVAIWFAHTLSRLVATRSWEHLEIHWSDVGDQLAGSWSIVAAAIPATVIFTLAGVHLFEVRTAFVVADVVGVLALAVVGVGTVGGPERSLRRRILYVVGLVSVGVMIVGLESVIHFF